MDLNKLKNKTVLIYGLSTFGLLLIFSIIGCLIFCGDSDALDEDKVVGFYSNLGGEDLEVDIFLKEDNRGELFVKVWTDDNRDFRESYKVSAKWAIRDGKVILVYNNIVDVFIFKDKLSKAEAGESGYSPGLIQIFPLHPRSLVDGQKLWKSIKK